jgi:hypothetical protein
VDVFLLGDISAGTGADRALSLMGVAANRAGGTGDVKGTELETDEEQGFDDVTSWPLHASEQYGLRG